MRIALQTVAVSLVFVHAVREGNLPNERLGDRKVIRELVNGANDLRDQNVSHDSEDEPSGKPGSSTTRMGCEDARKSAQNEVMTVTTTRQATAVLTSILATSSSCSFSSSKR